MRSSVQLFFDRIAQLVVIQSFSQKDLSTRQNPLIVWIPAHNALRSLYITKCSNTAVCGLGLDSDLDSIADSARVSDQTKPLVRAMELQGLEPWASSMP